MPPDREVASADELGPMWEEVQPRLFRALASMGAHRDEIEDASAEAVARALALEIPFNSPDELSRWLYVVARNLLVDGARKQRRLVSLPSLPEQRDTYDVGAHVEQRQRLHATAQAFTRLSSADQQAIRSALEQTPEPQCNAVPGTVAVRRHRARARLREAVGAPVVIFVRLRSFLTPASSDGRVAAMASLAAPVVMAGALLLSPAERAEMAVPLTTSAVAMPSPPAAPKGEPVKPAAVPTQPRSHPAPAHPASDTSVRRAPEPDAAPPPAATKHYVVDSVAPKAVEETKQRRIGLNPTLPLPDLPITLFPLS